MRLHIAAKNLRIPDILINFVAELENIVFQPVYTILQWGRLYSYDNYLSNFYRSLFSLSV